MYKDQNILQRQYCEVETTRVFMSSKRVVILLTSGLLGLITLVNLLKFFNSI